MQGEIQPQNMHHNREESWGTNMGNYGVGDYGGIQLNKRHKKKKAKTERAHRRGSLLVKPFHFKGSIMGKVKKHWKEEDEEGKNFCKN